MAMDEEIETTGEAGVPTMKVVLLGTSLVGKTTIVSRAITS